MRRWAADSAWAFEQDTQSGKRIYRDRGLGNRVVLTDTNVSGRGGKGRDPSAVPLRSREETEKERSMTQQDARTNAISHFTFFSVPSYSDCSYYYSCCGFSHSRLIKAWRLLRSSLTPSTACVTSEARAPLFT